MADYLRGSDPPTFAIMTPSYRSGLSLNEVFGEPPGAPVRFPPTSSIKSSLPRMSDRVVALILLNIQQAAALFWSETAQGVFARTTALLVQLAIEGNFALCPNC